MDYPIINLSRGQEKWEDGYNIGCTLEHFFPKEDALDFAAACANNDWGPVFRDGSLQIEGLLMLHEGENDGDDWVWMVKTHGHHFIAVGGCDYTGWDCQSNLRWSVMPPLAWSEPVDGKLLSKHLGLTE